MNLCWEMIRYLCFPLLDAHGAAEDCLRELRAGGDADRAKRACLAGWKQDIDELFAFLETARAEYALEDVRPVPFEWNIYRQRPQLRYSIASRIIREILEERYPVGSFLPSLPRMAERFGVAVSTVRRTLDLLAGLGVAASFQGKGTRVLMDPRRIDFSKPEGPRGAGALRGEPGVSGADRPEGVPLYAGGGVRGDAGPAGRNGSRGSGRKKRATLSLRHTSPSSPTPARPRRCASATASSTSCWPAAIRPR